MKQPRTSIAIIILMVLASNVAAAASKCTGANGKVIYTNTVCPSGYETKRVEENISVVDSSAERALIAAEVENAQAASADNSGNGISSSGQPTVSLSGANLALLKDAGSLGQTVITARERLGLAAALLIGMAMVLRILFRRRK